MSKSHLIEFLKTAADNSELRNKLQDLNAASVAELASAAGFATSEAEVTELRAESDALSDDAMERVIGGTSGQQTYSAGSTPVKIAGIRMEQLNNKYPENMKHEPRS